MVSFTYVSWQVKINWLKKKKNPLHFTHHHSELLRLGHVIIFILHLGQYIQLAFFRQLFNQVLVRNGNNKLLQ